MCFPEIGPLGTCMLNSTQSEMATRSGKCSLVERGMFLLIASFEGQIFKILNFLYIIWIQNLKISDTRPVEISKSDAKTSSIGFRFNL